MRHLGPVKYDAQGRRPVPFLTDYLDVLARHARYVPLTPANVAERVRREREGKVLNWIAEATCRREMYATRVAYRVEPGGVLTKMYAV